MAKNYRINYKRKAWGWGVFMLLIAAFVLANQFGGFVELGVWSIIVSALALAVIVECLMRLKFAFLLVPLATLYYVFQTPLELPFIAFWPLVLVTVLATIGLFALLPRRFGRRNYIRISVDDRDGYKFKYKRNKGDADEDGETVEDGDEDDDGNNPQVNVNLGHASRYLHSDNLETAELTCSFGALEVYFDHVQLSPEGAEIYMDCKFGAIELYVPKHWRVIDNLGCSFGGAEVHGEKKKYDDDAPQLTLLGNVSFGGIEVHRTKTKKDPELDPES